MFSTCPLVRPSVRSFVCILNDTNGSRGKGMKRSTLGARRSKVKVIRGRRWIWRPGGGISLDLFASSSFSSFMQYHQQDLLSKSCHFPNIFK